MTNQPHSDITPTISNLVARPLIRRGPARDTAPAEARVGTLVGPHFGVNLTPHPLVPAYPSAYPVARRPHHPFWQVNRLLSLARDPKDAAPSVRVSPGPSPASQQAPTPATTATQAAQPAQSTAGGPTGPGTRGSQHGPRPGQQPGLEAATVQPPVPTRTRSKQAQDMGNKQARVRRLSQSRLARLRQELSEREQQILQRIAQHGYLTTDQVQRFVFTDHASEDTAGRITRRVLGRLEQAGLVGSLRRRQGGLLGGSAPTTWHLSPGGARFLGGNATTYRRRTPSLRHLLHCVAVAEAHLQLIDHATALRASCIDVTVEPHSWRSYHGIAGERLTLKPDLAAAIEATDEHGSYRDEYLLEVDRGTESLPTLLKKAQVYVAYYNSGAWQNSTSAPEGVMPIVLWVMDQPEQANRLRQAIARSDLPAELFELTTLDDLSSFLNGADGERTGEPTTIQGDAR